MDALSEAVSVNKKADKKAQKKLRAKVDYYSRGSMLFGSGVLIALTWLAKP